MSGSGYVLALREVPLHPHSYVNRLEESFEKPSIVHVYSRDGLRSYASPPIYDDKYLVIFSDSKSLESNVSYIKFNIMFPVVLCANNSELENVKYLCQDKKIPLKIFENKFTKRDGVDLVRELAKEEVSESFCESLVSRVGLSPTRIVNAMMVMEHVGYRTGNIAKYVDKYRYTDIYEVIELLLGICKSCAHMRRVSLYLHHNRLWYVKYTRKSLIKEIDLLLKLYCDITQGDLCEYNLYSYLEQEKVSRYRVLYAVDLYEKVSYTSLLSLRVFLEKASLLEVVVRISTIFNEGG